MYESQYANGDTLILKKPFVWDTESCITECLKEKRKDGRIGGVFTGAKNDNYLYNYQKRSYFCHCAIEAEKIERPERYGVAKIKGCPIKGIT